MTDSPALARLRANHYNLADWNATTNPGGMGGDGHRYALVPPKAPQVPTYPVMVNDLVAVIDQAVTGADTAATAAGTLTGAASAAASSAGAAAGSATAAAGSATAAGNSATTAGNAATAASNAATAASGSASAAAGSATTAGNAATAAGNSATAASGSANAAAGSATTAGNSASAASGSAGAAAGSATTAANTLAAAQALLSKATLEGSATSSTSLSVDLSAKSLTVAANKAFAPGLDIQVTRVSSPTTWLRGAVTAYNAGTGALSFTPTTIAAPGGAGPFTDWAVSIMAGQSIAGGATVASLSGTVTLTGSSARVQSLDPNGASRDVILPAANSLITLGGPIHIIRNALAETGTIHVLDVKDAGGTLLRSLYPGDTAYVSLLANGTAAGSWDVAVVERDAGGVVVNTNMTGDLTLDRRTLRGGVVHLVPADSARSVFLPWAAGVDYLGGPLWYIRNASTTFPLTVRNGAGTVLATLSPLQTALVSCYNRSTTAGSWSVDVISNDPYGGSAAISLTADYSMTAWGPRTLRCTPNAAGRAINLPDATTYAGSGSPVAYIVNLSTSDSIQLRTVGGWALLAEIPAGQIATVHLLDRSNTQGTWFVVLDTRTTIATSVSGRQALSTNQLTFNHKLSPFPTMGKVLWSYNHVGQLVARVLTLAGKNVTVGPENMLTSIISDGNGQAITLSDTYGICVYHDSYDVYHCGFAVNLSTGIITMGVRGGGWGVGNTSVAEIRMDRVPGQEGCVVAMRRNSDRASLLRVVGFNGSTLNASGIVNGTNIELSGRHDIVAVSATEARHFSRNGGRLYCRPVSLSVPAMTIAVGNEINSNGDSTDVAAAAADATWAVTIYQDGSAFGAYARAWTGSMAGPQVTLAGSAAARHGSVAMWNANSGMFLYADNNGSNGQLYLQEFTLSTSSPYIVLDPAKKRLLNGNAGLAKSDHSHLAAALAMSASYGLLLFNDEGNSNCPTMIVVERGA